MDHNKLFIPGPTEVRPEILEAQTRRMIGHRSAECAELIASVQQKLKQVFFTRQPVFICACSGTGLQEAAVRNCTDRKVLNCVNGAFSDRWRKVTEANAKENEVLEVAWGQPILPDLVLSRLEQGAFDAITIVHNETSTGVISPIKEIASAIRKAPGGEEIMILVDAVSSLGGAKLYFDDWDLDVVLTSSQKALAIPPGLAFCAVSERAMTKAASVADRGYYLDFLQLAKYLERDQTPNTPPISLLFALDQQLSDILSEGLENRFSRHLAMRDKTIHWAAVRGMDIFAKSGFESPTVTCIENTLNLNIDGLNAFLRDHNMIISNGYGHLRGTCFRIAHMGDTIDSDVDRLLKTIDSYLTLQRSTKSGNNSFD